MESRGREVMRGEGRASGRGGEKMTFFDFFPTGLLLGSGQRMHYSQ